MKKFKIPTIPNSQQRTIRFPNDLIEKVNKHIKGTKDTFSSFVRKAVQMALKDLEEQEKNKYKDREL